MTEASARVGAAVGRARGFAFCWRVSLVALAFIVFGLGASLFGWLVLPVVWALGGSPLQRRTRCQCVVAACFRAFHHVLRAFGLVDFDVARAAAKPGWPRGRQFVAVANHPSLLENIAAIAVMGPVCCVVAPWLSRHPLLRPLMAWCGHVLTPGDALGDRLRALETAAARLAEGHSLLVFPEGTRSPLSGLGEFQRGAFELAMRQRLPILPVVCRVSPPVLTAGVAWYDLPDRSVLIELEPLDVLEPIEYSSRDAKGLARAVRERLLGELGLPESEAAVPK